MFCAYPGWLILRKPGLCNRAPLARLPFPVHVLLHCGTMRERLWQSPSHASALGVRSGAIAPQPLTMIVLERAAIPWSFLKTVARNYDGILHPLRGIQDDSEKRAGHGRPHRRGSSPAIQLAKRGDLLEVATRRRFVDLDQNNLLRNETPSRVHRSAEEKAKRAHAVSYPPSAKAASVGKYPR